MPTYFLRPENALNRANEFIDVDKKQRALDVLYDVIKSKKHRTWQKIHEQIMAKYLELCVDLRKSHIAKEGLYQYKIICQQVSINSLVDVVENYLKLAEKTTEKAREQSHQAVVDVDDLDTPDTPESLLMKAVSGEDTQDRTDRAILTPWVKFLWESYRQCLDLLRNNTRVERLYHNIAQQAFLFCINYNRKTEFRKLCDNLRTHLMQINKQQHQQTAINLNNVESQAMHLETRLAQLDSAISMELWQEAFKAVEDIYNLISLSKKPPKPALMANYYQKLGLVFWKSGNHLFHACTLHRLFHLSREQKKNLSQEELQRMATRVLCATLAVPIPPARNAIGQLLDMDESTLEKQRRLATLLMLNNPPNRQQLVKDLVRFSVIQYVFPELQNLYRWLEIDFHPLKLSDRVKTCIEFINGQPDLKPYVPALQDIIITRVLKQVSQVYQTIEFNRLAVLVPFASAFHLERVIVSSAKHLDLQVRINHRTNSLSFGTDLVLAQKEDIPEGPYIQSMPSERIRNQLSIMAQVLHKAVQMVRPKETEGDKEDQRKEMIETYRMAAKEEHKNILKRRQIIENRKEQLEHLNDQREREEQEQQKEQRRKAREAETARLEREAKEREKQRNEEEQKEIQRRHAKERIEQLRKSEMGAKFLQNIDEEDFADLDVDEIMARQVEQLEKEKKELLERLKAQEKKVDYFARAKRLEEIPLLIDQAKEEKIRNQEFWEEQEKERIEGLRKERELALETRNRLKRMKEDRAKFVKELSDARRSDFNERLQKFEIRMQEEAKSRLKKRKETRKKERREKYYREKEEAAQRLKEEMERKEMEEREEAERAERERREKEARERAAKLQEQSAKQKARDKEIEEKEARRREEQLREKRETEVAATPSWREGTKTEKSEVPKEKIPWKPMSKEGGWRERTTQREESWRVDSNKEPEDMLWKRGKTERIPARDVRYEDPPAADKEEGWSRGNNDDGPEKDTPQREGPARMTPARDNWREKSSRDGERGDRFLNDRWKGGREERRGGDDDDDWRKQPRGGRDDRRGGDDEEWRTPRGGRDEMWKGSRDSNREFPWRDRAAPREENWREKAPQMEERWRNPREDRGPRDSMWSRDRKPMPRDDDRGMRDRDTHRDEAFGSDRPMSRNTDDFRERPGKSMGSWRGGDRERREDRGPPGRDGDWGRRGGERGFNTPSRQDGPPPRSWRSGGGAGGGGGGGGERGSGGGGSSGGGGGGSSGGGRAEDDDGWTTVRY